MTSAITLPGAAQNQRASDIETPPVVGTASISGVIQDDQPSPRPVRRAVVTLTGEGLHPSRGAITDDDGRFTLRGLPAGRFTLIAERGGYVTSMYGARRAGRAGNPILLADGQQMTDLRLQLWRGAAVSGVLRDERGSPLPNAAVIVMPARVVTPVALSLSNASQAMTNDLGEYRIFGLEPGTYVVRAGSEGLNRPEIATSEAQIDAIFAALAARTKLPGTTAGAAARPAPRVEVTGQSVSSAPIYYPGTPTPTDATPMTLQAGDERTGLDFVVRRVRVSTIRGVIARSDGTPVPSASVQLASVGGRPSFLSTPALVITTGSDGTFQFGSVSPGEYRLLSRGAVLSEGAGVGAAASAMWWAEMPVLVTGDDVDVGRMTLERGMTFSGRVVVDTGATSPAPDLTGLRVQFESDFMLPGSGRSRGRALPGGRFLPPAAVGADGTFTVIDLVPDNYRVIVSGAAISESGWWLRAAIVEGRDVLDLPLRIAPGEQIRGAQLVLSDRRTELSGTLTTATGAAFPAVFVVAFPTDPTMRLPDSRRVQVVRPDSGGRFVFQNLPAGDYLLCALTDIDDGQWREPGFFDALAGVSLKITLAHGERKVQDLRVGVSSSFK